jgi:hypothetical protein
LGKKITLNITQKEYDVLCLILQNINDRCFHEKNKEGNYYSGEGFAVMLEPSEYTAFKHFVKYNCPN